ncbi:Pirin domain protein [Paludibacter propionicigenes WB4]|uniref:Pirin domain protein n=1 Tax=Paludibacter propionicigenes (strain DSM 17365 / JCM 13257 / WB4) TaxID=694427 RepID=E4T394_PALPW|nr:pirin family protein [Paludibacter propionicigenes]ADQ79188.1 Pirin domain protein [Paludibacter propionicigenes WB4]
MNKQRSIEQIIPPPPAHMVGDGFRVHNFFPSTGRMNIQRMSPFFLLDYGAKIEFPPSDTPRGVGVHPHRGFETVTIAYKGRVAHHDSAGNAGIIGEGDVQWMTAASGILHKEYHEAEWSKVGGEFQMVQLWVNLPAKFKMSNPKYQPIRRSEFGQFALPDGNGVIEIIAGNFNNTNGPATSFTPIEMYNARLKKGAKVHFSLPQNYNTGFVIIEGSVTVNERSVATDHFVLFANDGTDIYVEATEDAIVLVLSGEPIQEPIVPYGPFVMNSKQEIVEAYDDWNSGKFGVLED